MAEGKVSLPVVRGAGETSRTDLWWLEPLVVFVVFASFVVYATWAAFQGNHYYLDKQGQNYLSPFYSPEIIGNSPHAWIRGKPDWWPGWLVFSPALLILGGPVGFRMTCYYYRGAYYKAFWADPPNCAVGEPRGSYLGENTWPLLIQNIHRYFLYIALIFIAFLAWDAIQAFIFTNAAGNKRFGIGVGSFVLTLNVILLGGYTLGCHSLRHLVGGGCDELGKSPTQKSVYDCVSCLNEYHMVWAWCSLFWVGFSDIYVRLCSMGIWTDFHFVF
ncbi:MAG: succinate dehydrogenase [Planctomycetes bacterium]|nr:succinate dehydrogenase [Planctomycetota bacterium]